VLGGKRVRPFLTRVLAPRLEGAKRRA
jgi:hypothetical protein